MHTARPWATEPTRSGPGTSWATRVRSTSSCQDEVDLTRVAQEVPGPDRVGSVAHGLAVCMGDGEGPVPVAHEDIEVAGIALADDYGQVLPTVVGKVSRHQCLGRAAQIDGGRRGEGAIAVVHEDGHRVGGV